MKVDGEGWERLILTDHNYRRILDVNVKGNLGNVIGLTELFSESAEPSLEEVSKDEFLELFPEGDYFYFGRTVEMEWMVGEATLTHDLPCEAVLLSPAEDGVVNS